MSDRVRLWCLRHAEAQNVLTRIAGAVSSPPLTTRGRRQAIDAASTLAAEPITAVYSSTALRARQTAQCLATMLGLDVVAMPELVEVGIGRHEGTDDPAVRLSLTFGESGVLVCPRKPPRALRLADDRPWGRRAGSRVASDAAW